MATIKDIAKIAGVSMMTVSRAFNKPEIVKEDVREQIFKIAKELNYVPNQAARSLANSKTGVIQIVARMHPDDYYFTQLFTGAAHFLSDNGYSIMINQHRAKDYQFDGAIFMGLSPGDDKNVYETLDKPFVIFGKTDLPIDWVDIDNVDGTYKITKYLIENGHRKIGFIGIDQDEDFTVERYVGFVKAMEEFNVPINEKDVFKVEHSIKGVREISDEAIHQHDVTAFVCESDVLAYGLIDYAKEHGINIPEDLSVVGFDGFLFNRMSVPHITTVKQPVYKIGVEIAKALVARINNPQIPKQSLLIQAVYEPGDSVKNLNER